MMDKYAFNEEAARAGRPIEFATAIEKWVDAHFIGISHSGRPVVEVTGIGPLFASRHMLRMKRVTKTIYVNLYENGSWRALSGPGEANESALMDRDTYPLRAVAVPVEVED